MNNLEARVEELMRRHIPISAYFLREGGYKHYGKKYGMEIYRKDGRSYYFEHTQLGRMDMLDCVLIHPNWEDLDNINWEEVSG